ncbi:MAG: hypothetical protein WKF31_10590 [Thermoleophilaceae bacterium]
MPAARAASSVRGAATAARTGGPSGHLSAMASMTASTARPDPRPIAIPASTSSRAQAAAATRALALGSSSAKMLDSAAGASARRT